MGRRISDPMSTRVDWDVIAELQSAIDEVQSEIELLVRKHREQVDQLYKKLVAIDLRVKQLKGKQ